MSKADIAVGVAVTTLLALFGYALYAYTNSADLKTRTAINKSDRAAEFILECAKAANPMSDEEPEDLVHQCEITARGIYGHEVFYIYHKYSRHCETVSAKETKKCWAKITGDNNE